MNTPQTLAVLIYLAVVPIAAFLFAWAMPKMPDSYKQRELAAIKRAYHPDTPRGSARRARRQAEKARDEWYSMSRLLEALEASGRGTWTWLLLALLWPGFIVLTLLSAVVAIFGTVYDCLDGTHIECDACEKKGPWGWTFRRARRNAEKSGWAVALPTKEDLCPDCVAREGVTAG